MSQFNRLMIVRITGVLLVLLGIIAVIRSSGDEVDSVKEFWFYDADGWFLSNADGGSLWVVEHHSPLDTAWTQMRSAGTGTTWAYIGMPTGTYNFGFRNAFGTVELTDSMDVWGGDVPWWAFRDGTISWARLIISGEVADGDLFVVNGTNLEPKTISEIFTDDDQPDSDEEVPDGITVTPINPTTEAAIEAVVDHDDFQGVDVNEHRDWTQDQGATDIHPGNYTDTNTTYSAGDGLTLDGTEMNFDGGAAPGGDLSGTWAEPTVNDYSHDHALSNIDQFTEAALEVALLSVSDVFTDNDGALDDDDVTAADLGAASDNIANDGTVEWEDADGLNSDGSVKLAEKPDRWWGGEFNPLRRNANGELYLLTTRPGMTARTITQADSVIGVHFDPTWFYVDGAAGLSLLRGVGQETYGAGWDGDTGGATRDDLYDYMHTLDTDDDGDVDNVDSESLEDGAGAMFSGNTETRCTVTYQDSDGTVDFVVDDMTDVPAWTNCPSITAGHVLAGNLANGPIVASIGGDVVGSIFGSELGLEVVDFNLSRTGDGNGNDIADIGEAEVDEILIDSTPGLDHSASGKKAVFTNGNAGSVAFGDVCYIASDGDLEFADSDTAATMPGIYMALGTIATTASGEWLIEGFARDDSWSWTPGGLVYISVTGTTGNTLTQTAPSGSGDQVQIVGIATHADRIHFKPNLMLIVAPSP